MLLGRIIESATGDGLAEALRTLLDFDGLWMTSTYLETLDITVVRTINQALPDEEYDLSDLVIAVLQALGAV